MPRIELVTGEVVAVEGQALEEVMATLTGAGTYSTGSQRWVRFETEEGPTYVNPAHAVRVFD